MKMKKSSIKSVGGFILFLYCLPCFGWGSKGHEVIANIAEAHLSKRAKKEVRRLLEGHAPAYYSVWMDEIRSDSTYAYTYTWHYANVDKGEIYETQDKQPGGDVVTAVTLSVNQLKNRNQPDSVRSMYLKFLIHLAGDMHCPMHAGRAGDRGGNDYPVIWKKEKTNLHRLWDDLLITGAKNWGSLEWATYINMDMSKNRQKAIKAGTPLDWFNETVALADGIYENTPKDEEVPQTYVRKYTPVIEEQFIKAGYRLAGLLNSLF